jgi:hypothetical protein
MQYRFLRYNGGDVLKGEWLHRDVRWFKQRGQIRSARVKEINGSMEKIIYGRLKQNSFRLGDTSSPLFEGVYHKDREVLNQTSMKREMRNAYILFVTKLHPIPFPIRG